MFGWLVVGCLFVWLFVWLFGWLSVSLFVSEGSVFVSEGGLFGCLLGCLFLGVVFLFVCLVV